MSIHTEHLWVVGIHPKNMCVFVVCLLLLPFASLARSSVFVCVSLCRVCAQTRNWNRTLCESSSPKYNSFQWAICTVFFLCRACCWVFCAVFSTSNQFLSILPNKNIEKWFPRLKGITKTNSHVIINRRLFLLKLKKRSRNDNNSKS